MKIKILHSCVGKDGEHLEAMSEIDDYDDAAAKNLIRLGRAEALDGDEIDESEPVKPANKKTDNKNKKAKAA